MQSDNVVLYSKIYLQYFNYVKAEKGELKRSPSVQYLSVRMPRCSFQLILTGTNHLPCYASLQAGMGSIPSGIDPFNFDMAGMSLSLLMLFSVVYSVFVITLQLYLIIYQSMTTIVSLLLFIILFLSIIVMYLHHCLHQVYSEGKCITPVINFN